MAINLVGVPQLRLTYKSPTKSAKSVGIRAAKWEGAATVRVIGEAGRKWRIGFVQTLNRNSITAVYTKTRIEEVLITGKSLPVLDGSKAMEKRPFYSSRSFRDVQHPLSSAPAYSTNVNVTLWDEPESPYDWYYNGDANDPLTEMSMSLQFTTWVAARDITGGATLAPQTLQLLAQWNLVLERRYRFQVGPGLRVSSGGRISVNPTDVACEVLNPSRTPTVTLERILTQPPSVVWTSDVANNCFTDKATGRTKAQFGGVVSKIAGQFGGTGTFKRP